MEKNIEEQQNLRNASDMLYLTICAINEEIPDVQRVKQMDLTHLFKISEKHTLTACVAYALESADIHEHTFTQAKEKAIRKNILLDAERKKILQCLEQEKIWYLPLKGAILKDWYPKIGMRQMSDNDILFDASFRSKVKDLMLSRGFTCVHFGDSNDDAYFKPPIHNFEMHNALFTIAHGKELCDYYQDIKSKLIQDTGTSYGYHFKNEDFYIYLTAHEYKHFCKGGTGIRSLTDAYIFMKKFEDSLDWDYLKPELQKLNLTEYEQKRRTLAKKLFLHETLTQEEEMMLNYYKSSGAYGTLEHAVTNNLIKNGKGSKVKYLFWRVFPPMNQVKSYWNFFYRHKWLLPVLWIYRPIHGLLCNRSKLRSEFNYLKKK